MQRAAQPVNFVAANAFAALDTVKIRKKKATKDAEEKDKKSQSQPTASNGNAAAPTFSFPESKVRNFRGAVNHFHNEMITMGFNSPYSVVQVFYDGVIS